jgi:hypothetical protein
VLAGDSFEAIMELTIGEIAGIFNVGVVLCKF